MGGFPLKNRPGNEEPVGEEGLPKGEAVVYLVSEHKLDSESQAVQRYGISADYFRTEAFTIMSAEEWYLKKGKAQAETITANWLTFLRRGKRLDS